MIDVFIGGDIFLGDNALEEIAKKGDPTVLFNGLLDRISKSDLSIANLESPILKNGTALIKTGPVLKSTPQSLGILKNAGFDLLTLANNHILDYGEFGLSETLRTIEFESMKFVGAGLNKVQARKPFKIQIKGKTIGVINVAENEFSTFNERREYGANPIDLIENFYDIQNFKKEVDFLFVIVHGGREHYNLPSPEFKKTLKFYAEAGANAVVAHHTHCVSGFENHNGVPIFYGLGNFVFNNIGNNRPLWNIGLAVQFHISEDNKCSFDLLSFNQCKGDNYGIELHQKKEKESFLNQLNTINKIIQDENLLRKKWLEYVENQRNAYLRHIFIKNSLVKKLVNRKILPESLFINENHKVLLSNLIRCETHREIILNIFSK